MVFVPRPGITPLMPPPDVDILPGMLDNRGITRAFIMNDPTLITLIPTVKVRKPGGGFDKNTLAPRPAQYFKVIPQSGSADGIVDTSDGKERRYNFVLVGEWDATVQIGDFWIDPDRDDFFWSVQGFQPYNGYEVKFGVIGFGGDPGNG